MSDDGERASASQIFNAFSEGGLRCPSSLPTGVFVAAAIGRKGSSFWHSQAAVDQVMVSMNKVKHDKQKQKAEGEEVRVAEAETAAA